MEIPIMIILTVIVLILILIMIYISLYNKIKYSKMRIDDADNLIKEQLEERYNLLTSIKKTIQKNTKMDLKIYDELEKLKNSNYTPYNLEKKITEAVNVINLIQDDYPKLCEKKDFKEYLRKIDESNTKLDAAKSFYNEYNNKLSKQLKKLPSKIIASINKIKILPYYEGKQIFNENDDGIKI